MVAHKKKLAEIPVSEVSRDIINFIIFYRNEVSHRLYLMQQNEDVKESDKFLILNCPYWCKMAHRHAEKLFKTVNPDPESIAYKVTLNGMNTDKSYVNTFPVLQEIVLNNTGNTKFLFRLPYATDNDPNVMNTQGWGSFEIHLNPTKYKPSRLTPKCVFWYFPEQDVFAIYSFTY